MKTILLMTMAALFCLGAAANTQKADRLFDHWEYFRAAKLYEKEASKYPSAEIYFKLGECYRKMNLRIEAQAAYDKVHTYGIYNKPEFYLNYGQVLKSNGRNDEAKFAFDKYSELVPSDSIGKFFSESIAIVTEDHLWDEPVLVNNVGMLNSPNADLCPVIYKDGIIFTSNRKTPESNKIYGWTGENYLDLFYAKKGDGDLDYTNITAFGGNKIIKRYNDGPACFSKYFDTIYISRVDRDLKGEKKATLKIERNKIFMSAMRNGKWIKAIPFYLNNDAFSVANPFLSADGSRIYFVSDMPGGYGETDIYYCNRERDNWSKPINMGPNVNTFNREKYPSMDADGNFYFSSDGYQGFGGLDICVSLDNNGVLAKAKPLKCPINSSADDFGIVFLKDRKTGYITSNRLQGGQGNDDIYYFDMLTDNVNKDLATSIYTIGYRRKMNHVKAVAPIVEFKPPATVKDMPPTDLRIYFDFDKYAIRPDAIVHLDSVINFMNGSDMDLLIGGHCDSRGASAYNINLSLLRCESALNYLANKGVSPKRMNCTGYGFNQLVNHCEKGTECTDREHQSNRSAYFHFEVKKKVPIN